MLKAPLVAAILSVVAAAALGTNDARSVTSVVGVRIYDPLGRVAAQVRPTDVIRPSARASRQADGSGYLYFRLTKNGAVKFTSLTRALARRGALLQRPQRFAFAVNGRVYARPFVDYRAFPNGLDGRSGISVEGLPFAMAQRLAREIRNG